MRILYIIPSYDNGGTLTCLRNLLTKLDKKKYEIEVFAITDSGPNRDFVAQQCTILNAQGKAIEISTSNNVVQLSLKYNIVRNIAFAVKSFKKNLDKVGVDISPIVFRQVAKKLEARNYGLVIAFQEGLTTQLGSYFNRTPKIAWVHCDYTRCVQNEDTKPLKRYAEYKKIVCVSEFTKQQFISVAPQYADKTYSLHNIVDDELIIKRATEPYVVPFDTSAFTIVSVGRLDPVKRFSMIPEIASRVKAVEHNIKWYIFGGGYPEEETLIKENIKKYNVADVVIMAGEVNNPYPYIANADLLVSTSLSEACPCVFSEAFILHTPILSADFGSAPEFIKHGVNGWISPINEMHGQLLTIVSDDIMYNKIASASMCSNLDNLNLLKQFHTITQIQNT